MSFLDANILAAAIGGNKYAEKELRKKVLRESGATFNENLQCYELRGKNMSVEMALFGPLETLERFTTPQE